MSKNKKMSRDEQIEDVQEKLTKAREMRLKLAGRKAAPQEDVDAKKEFEIFWARERASYKKDREIQEILWLHLKAIKHDHPDKFEQGVAHFGLKKLK